MGSDEKSDRSIQQRTHFAMAWDGIMAALALISVAMVFWHEKGGIGPVDSQMLEWIDLGIVGLFMGDWLYFFRKSKQNWRYIKRTWWDLLGMVPLILGSAGILRLFRLFRLFRVLRAVRSINRFLDSSQTLAKDSNLGRIGIAAGTVTLTGALLVWLVEKDTPNSGLTTYGETLWWAIVTVTTVGYGDVTPVTTLGRSIAVLLMIAGIGTIAGLASGVSSALISPKSDDERSQSAAIERAVNDGEPGTHIPTALAQLSNLHDDKKLTDDEFAQAKAKLLSE